MPEYRIARADEEREILDFSNMVFAMSSGPIDFAKLYPAIYGRSGFADLHIIARDDQGHLASSIAVKPMQLKLGENESLSVGYLGTVATHPRERGKGYMKQLMQLNIERARKAGMDLLALGGQRQRYNHYGFESCAPVISFSLNAANLRGLGNNTEYRILPFSKADESMVDTAYQLYQGLEMAASRNREDFCDILLTGGGMPYLVLKKDQVLGYLYACGHDIYEFACVEGTDLQQLCKCWLSLRGCGEFGFTVPMHQKNAIRALGEIAESWSLHDDMMTHVLNWPTVLEKLMNHKAKHQPLRDGEAVIEIKGAALLRLTVRQNKAVVQELKEADDRVNVSLTELEAVRRFLSPFAGLQEREDSLYGWFPLMFSIPRPDWF